MQANDCSFVQYFNLLFIMRQALRCPQCCDNHMQATKRVVLYMHCILSAFFLNLLVGPVLNLFLTPICSTGIKEDKHFRILLILKYVLKL